MPTSGQNREASHPGDFEERIERVAELFWESLHSGEAPDRHDYLQQYPELDEPLRKRLALIALMYRQRLEDRSGPPFHLPQTPTEAALHDALHRALAGDPAARDETFDVLRPLLGKIASSRAEPSGRTGGALTPLQEALLRALLKLESIPGGSSQEETLANFLTWIREIVRRRGTGAEEKSRQRSLEPSGQAAKALDAPADKPMPGADASEKEEKVRIHKALAWVPDWTDQAILCLHLFDGLTFPRIAERVDLDFRRVRKRYRRAVGLLEEELRDLL